MMLCQSLGPLFRFGSESDAFSQAKKIIPDVYKHARANANMYPGKDNHVNLRCDGGERAGSIVCCDCCQDMIAGFAQLKKCAYIP
jgi:hypothetical protein